MAVFNLVAGNTAPNLSVTLTDADGAKDLTGATVSARLTERSTSAVHALDCEIVDPPTDGNISVPPPEDGWPAGEFTIEYDVTFADESEQTWPSDLEDADLLRIRRPSEVPVV
jgi:hypothetical protein